MSTTMKKSMGFTNVSRLLQLRILTNTIIVDEGRDLLGVFPVSILLTVSVVGCTLSLY
jgi:hypothetical protein